MDKVEFVCGLNEMYDSIKFMVEQEQEGKLAFLDILIMRRADGRLDQAVYWKETHTELYLNNLSSHHPEQKRSVVNFIGSSTPDFR